MPEFDADAVMSLIAQRCDDLDPDTLAEVKARLAGRPVVALDGELADRLADVLRDFDERQRRLERTSVNAGEDALVHPPQTWQ